MQTKKLRWLIAHEPNELFLRTAIAFAERLKETTNGRYEVEIFTVDEYEAKFKKFTDPGRNFVPSPMVLLESGAIELSQLHITELAQFHSPDFFALEMPFLFKDHDHAARVFEGEIGKKMLNNLKDRSPATGLAFTYSGGFRCVAADHAITSLDQLKGIKYATCINPVTIDMVEALGAIAEPLHIKDFIKKFQEEGVTAAALETTIPRYLAQFTNTTKKHLLNTKHNLFLTAIIIGNEFLASLSDEDRAAFYDASEYASRLERKWSVEEAIEFADKKDHSDIGVTYTELSAEETEKFKALTAPLYDKYKDFFSVDLVDGIIRS